MVLCEGSRASRMLELQHRKQHREGEQKIRYGGQAYVWRMPKAYQTGYLTCPVFDVWPAAKRSVPLVAV